MALPRSRFPSQTGDHSQSPEAGDPASPQPPQTGSSSINLGFIYFVLFRHKWKILLCTALGIGAAFLVFKLSPPHATSTAKLLVRYIEERQDTLLEDGTTVTKVDSRGETIMRTEVEILTSFNLAEAVARVLGPGRVLTGVGIEPTLGEAAAFVRDGLVVESSRNSSVITLGFNGPEPSTLQPILEQVIKTYLDLHAEAHRNRGARDDALTQETDQLRLKLNETEEELRKMLESAGVISIDEAKRVFGLQIERLQDNIMNAETDLAGSRAALRSMVGEAPGAAQTTDDVEATVAPLSDQILVVYRQLNSQLETLYRREQELLLQFTAETPMVKGLRAQITEGENTKARLEREHPGLVTQARLPATPSVTPGTTAFDPAVETARIRSLESRIAAMRTQLANVRQDVSRLGGLETTINELQRRRELLASQYSYFADNLEKKRIDVTLGSVSNISIIQTPSPPVRDLASLLKKLLVLCVGGVGFGLALAFAIEMFLDQTVKRPTEIESTLGFPLVLAIPRIKLGRVPLGSGIAKLFLRESRQGNTAGTENARTNSNGTTNRSVATPSGDSSADGREFRTYLDALRNRLIYSFEMRGITRKPKLVAVTACGPESGVSTIAAGLAASLSETGDGNVLLVDMNPDRKTPKLFQKGNLKVGLDDVLASETRDDAMVGENLYVVSQHAADDRLSWIIPKKFAALVPKMKASDFDYIIFDMPPVSQISATPHLARFMDQVLMVVEAEKTSRDAVKRAGGLLADTGASIGVVLNKSKRYVPRALMQEV